MRHLVYEFFVSALLRVSAISNFQTRNLKIIEFYCECDIIGVLTLRFKNKWPGVDLAKGL